jgi:hypothetical protein
MSLVQQYPNPGIYVIERDRSRIDRTEYSGVVHLVVGNSRKGPYNNPQFIETRAQFIQTFGNIDTRLERRSSYFHRTVLKMLESGPVYAMNILKTDPELDITNFKSFSCATHISNEINKEAPYSYFYDRTGFWRRSTDQLLWLTQQNGVEEDKLLHFVNFLDKPITIFAFKSNLKGFNIPLEDWYGTDNVPLYLHPKDWASDYIVRVVAISGDWTNYQKLSTDPKYAKYFDFSGLRKSAVDALVSDSNFDVVGDWDVSLIPYFKDTRGTDMYIESVINSSTNETGIFVSYNTESFETDYRNGFVDMIGQNLIYVNNRFEIDFLSYRENLSDTRKVEESKLDINNNSWGDPNWAVGRTNLLAEGYVHNSHLRPLIISQTTSTIITPLATNFDSYAILKGERVNLPNDPEYLLEIDKYLSIGQQMCLSIVLNSDGINFRLGTVNKNSGTLHKPEIDPINEIVLGYYRISKTSTGDITTELFPVCLTEENDYRYFSTKNFLPSWRTPFVDNSPEITPEVEDTYTSRIDFVDLPEKWQAQFKFENATKYVPGDYDQNRVLYYYNYLKNNVEPNTTIILDVDGKKQVIRHVQFDTHGEDKYILIEIDLNANGNLNGIQNLPGFVAIYFNDIEFLVQDETLLSTTNYPFNFGDGGIIGKDSSLYQQYYNGDINTGDRVFKELDVQQDVLFRTRENRYEVVFPVIPDDSYLGKLFFVETEKNDGIYNVIKSFVDGDSYIVWVEEPVEDEFVDVLPIYNANQEFYLEFSLNENTEELAVKYVEVDLQLDNKYKKIKTTVEDSYRRTIEIEHILDSQTILLDYERYAGEIFVGNFIRIDLEETEYTGEIPRGLGRVIDVHRYDTEGKYLYVQADGKIFIRNINIEFSAGTGGFARFRDLQAEMYLGIHNWVNSFKGNVLDGFKVREECLPDGTDKRLQSIISVMAPNTGIFSSLSNIDNITWRYLIDSYGLGFDPEVKRPLAKLCEQHKSFGFINMPSIKEFKKNSDTTFVDENGSFSVSQVVIGGSKQHNDASYFSIINGSESSYIGYFFPFIQTLDADNRRPIFVPPAAWSADAFMENKWQTTIENTHPWTIIAGVRRGRISDISGLENSFSVDDLNLLHQSNMNPITVDNNLRFHIYTNNTAYSLDSSLQFINSREALNDLELSIRNMLLRYHWSANTRNNRAEIVRKANIICESYKSRNAVYAYFNKMDSDNNTPEMIDSGVGLLETWVETVKGMGTIILRVTILKTGEIRLENIF